MENSIESLRGEREEILREIAGLGEFRLGMVSASYRRCGKPGCRGAHGKERRDTARGIRGTGRLEERSSRRICILVRK